MTVMTSFFRRRGAGAKLGQHFLTNPSVANTVAEAAGATPGATILEVGPGKGFLTRALLARGARVVAIEKDPALVTLLEATFAEEIRAGKLTLVRGDAREQLSQAHFSNLALPRSYAVAANIPYYITGELIRLFLTTAHQPERVAVLLQKEVAERIARSAKESILSLSVKVYGTPRYIRTVPAGNFNPPPKVDSAVLLIENISRDSFTACDENLFFALVRAGFGQKRKTLLGNLTRAYGEEVRKVWDTLALERTARAEDLSLAQWFLVVRALSHILTDTQTPPAQ
jgi:16S rRNA (adenine1518-N6/adenine1519-N6)-dimethyltransferase